MGTVGLTFVLAGKTQQSVKRNMGNVLAKQFGKILDTLKEMLMA